MLLKDKIALVTGATRGIGLAISRCFSMEGAQVFISGRDMASLTQARDSILIDQPTARIDILLVDVTNPDQVREAFQSLFSSTKRLDILVANAGIMEDALIGMVSPVQILKTFEVNTFGVFYCLQYASRLMARQKSGSIITLTSIIGSNGCAGKSAYAGSKAAVIGMTKSLAKELAAQNIRVNAIAPGFIDTDMTRLIPADKYQQTLDSVGMGRIGRPEEVAAVALFLASDLASYVTGQVLGVDGGMLV